MVRDKLVAVKERPEEILERLLKGFVIAQDLSGGRDFARCRFSSECCEEYGLDLDCVLIPGIDDLLEKPRIVRIQSFVDESSIHHHERLRNGAVEGRRFVVFVSTEFENELLEPILTAIFPGRPIGALVAMNPDGNLERVEELFGTHGFDDHVRESRRFSSGGDIVDIGSLTAASELIGFGSADPADEFF